jgi:hypothetical protein
MGNDAADQLQHGRIERIVQGSHRGAVAAGGGDILDEIIAADRIEIDGEGGDVEGGSGHLHHHAEARQGAGIASG